jgi:signal transduction histidine kinase
MVWNWIGHVPLRTKILGIVIAATCLTASGVVLWTNGRLNLLDAQNVSELQAVALTELLVAVGIAMGVGLVVAWVLTNVLTQQVDEVTRVAQQVERGNLSRRAPIWANDEIGALAQSFNAMIDSLTQSRESLVTANVQLGARNEKLIALYELALLATRAPNTNSSLPDVLAKILEITRCDAGAVLLTREDGTLAVCIEQQLTDALRDHGIARAKHDPLLQQVLQSGEALRILPGERFGGDGASALCEAAIVDGFALVYALPLQTHGVVNGVTVLFKRDLPVSAADDPTMPFLVAICGQLSVVVENSTLWEELKRKEAVRARLLATAVNAQEQERERISRELHDETGQALTALLIQLKVLEGLRGEEAIAAHAAELRKLVLVTLEEVRRLARDLRPGTLDELGLVPTIEWHLRTFGRNADLRVEFEAALSEGLRLPVHTELALYRVVQEALTNIARHARATRTLIRLEEGAGSVRLTVQDNGCGFDVPAVMTADERGVGLLGIQERVELIGGTLTIESSGHGTRLSVDVPIQDRVDKLEKAAAV